ncbi:S8 family peptidase [Aquimarina sp. MMG016]|uniref:S8 family peptidase n=1 Tax=Aquimarina sp. MMG016 TaxID=2822690 RepID=UPI001B3A4725|nr:S8 family peptidase [Aquimarina sp. MMG016]MBQ4821519.1 S8 family peptidase [Aquimarina sp. MMG016]
MKNYQNSLRNISSNEPIFSIPPFKVEQVYTANSQTIDWGVELLGVPNFWRFTKGKGVKVAVLDTGVTYTHPDLRGAICEMKDFTNSPSGVGDVNGHGTHCAGIIAARDNSTGVIGVAPESQLIIGKVLGDDGSGSEDMVANGVQWAVEKGAHIISMSLGSPYPSEKIYNAIKAAMDDGVFVICAAGNNGPSLDSVDYPGAFEETIAVGSIDRRKRISKFSSNGVQVDIVAPGDEILSTYPPRGLAKLSGTSMATPFVAGISALILSKHNEYLGQTPIKKQKDLEEHLRKTAIDLGLVGFDIKYGYGLINPEQLFSLDYSQDLDLLAIRMK